MIATDCMHEHDVIAKYVPYGDSISHFLVDNIGGTAAIAALLAALLAACVLNRRCWRFLTRHLKSLALVVFLSGVGLYFVGFNEHGSHGNVLTLLLRSCISSIEMFVSESDLIEVRHTLHCSPIYMTLFAVVHFAAVFASAIFILQLFGQRLMSVVHLWIVRRSSCRKLYVLLGVNEKSLILAESVERQPGDAFIFVKFPRPGHDEHSSGRFSFSHFFHSGHSEEMSFDDRIGLLHGITLTAHRRIDASAVTAVGGWAAFFGHIGLKQLGKTIARFNEVEIYLLADIEQDNIDAAYALKRQDAACNRPMAATDATSVYCHARGSNMVRGLLSGPGLEYRVHLIDSSLLSVLQLKENGRNHPVNFVQADAATGTVQSPFSAMIVGFGEAGADTLRFLYEFGSFVKGSHAGDDGYDTVATQKRTIYVTDLRLQPQKSQFLNDAPALRDSADIVWLDGMSPESDAFWQQLRSCIDSLNYVVVTVGNDDEMAASTAIRIYEYAYRYRTTMERFKVLVRLHDKGSKTKLESIAKYGGGIEAFGIDCEVFSHAVISAVSRQANAKNYFYQYCLLSTVIDQYSTPEEKRQRLIDLRNSTPEAEWRKRRENALRQYTIENETKIAYQEEQDRSDVCHIFTKLALAGAIAADGGGIDSERLRHLVHIATHDEQNLYPHATTEADRRLLANLCYNEHLRWNAKMELLGFVHGGPGKDLKRKTHYCIVDNNELVRNEATRPTLAYDMGVVELSFKTAMKQIDPNFNL